MRNRTLLPALLSGIAAVACGASEPAADDAPPAAAGDAVLRTADPAARGLTAEDFPLIEQLADGVYTYSALHPSGALTSVSLFVVTSEGVLVADGQGSVEETQRLVDTIAGITDQPITHVVISSDHGDHTGGNSAFPGTANFLAHPTSAANLEASANRPDRSADAPPVVLPTELVEDRRVLRLGDEEIRILFLGRAHTGGDLVVYLPAEKILFMSETYLNRVFPAMRSAYPSEWVEMIEQAQAMDVDIFVPGHGFVDPPEVLEEELERYQEALRQVIAEATRLHHAGIGVDDAIEQARFGELENWTLRSSQGPIAIRRVYMELNGELPGG